jgi:hypothetical protein
MTLRLRFKVARQPQEAQAVEIFSSVLNGRGPKPGSLGASLVIHALVVLLTVFVSHHLARDPKTTLDLSKYDVQWIRLRLDEPLYFNAKKTSDGNASSARPAPAGKPAAEHAANTAVLPSALTRPALPRRLELPAPQQAARNAAVVIQPELRPELPPPATLPPMALWARRDPEPQRPTLAAEVIPGRAEAASERPKLAAPPALAAPNKETAVADRNVSLPRPDTSIPALPLRNSATMPVRLRDAQESQAASFDSTAGQPVNVIAIAREWQNTRTVDLAKGAQNIPAADTGEGPAAAASDGRPGTRPAAVRGSLGSNSDDRSPQSGQDARGPGGSPGSRNTSGTAGAPVSTDGPAMRTATAGPGSMTATTVGSPPARAAGTPPPTRIDHPVKGNFDVVVMQSATRDDLLALGETLSGSPVYSVYLRVGDRKEWLMEYCVPVAQQAQSSPYQLNLDDGGTIAAPYPITTVIPGGLAEQAFPNHIVLRGFLTAAGNLRGVKSPDSRNPLLEELLAFLSQWQFRPAQRNQQPIDVEILLVIPARG